MLKNKLQIALGCVLAGATSFGLMACTESDKTTGITEEGNEVAVNVVYDLWSSNLYQVSTGNDDSGYWFSFSDDADGNNSNITWPVEKGNEYDGDAGFDPVIDKCGGLCGTVTLNGSDGDVYAGVAFNVGTIGEDGEAAIADISSWNGLCVTYKSDFVINVKIGLDDELERSLAYDVPFVTFPKTAVAETHCAQWSKFMQAGYGLTKITGEEAAQKAKEIRLVFVGSSGTTGEFNIKGISTYNAAYEGVVVPSESSSSTQSSSSFQIIQLSSSSGNDLPSVSSSSEGDEFQNLCQFSEIGDLWIGDNLYRVETGLDNELELSGYWYPLEEANNVSVVFPAGTGNEYEDENALDSIIDFCSGICGTAQFQNDAYAGVGFNVSGPTSENADTLDLADVSSWDGLCVTYASELDIEIAMSDEIVVDSIYQRIPQLAKVSLPANKEANTKCVEWSDFVTPDGGTVSSLEVASLLFVVNGNADTESKFNILGLGTFQTLSEQQSSCTEPDGFVTKE